MEKLRENVPRYQELAIPRKRFHWNGKVDPFKVKRGALSYRITDSLNTLAKPRRIPFKDEPIKSSTPRASNVLSFEDSERDAKLLTSRGIGAKILPSRARNQLDLDTYAQMVKRGSLSYRIPDSLQHPKRPRRTAYQDEAPIDYSPPRAWNVRPIADGEKRSRLLISRPKNYLDLDTYAQMVVNNDKQCPNRIKRLARPRRNYIDCNDLWMDHEHDYLHNDLS